MALFSEATHKGEECAPAATSSKIQLTAAEKREAKKLVAQLMEDYKVEFKSLTDLTHDPEYHDDPNPARIDYIVQHFNPAALRPIVVSERGDGIRRIVNGRHTTQALIKLGYTQGPTLTLRGLTSRQEAAIMLTIQDQKAHKALTKKASFAARVTAKESGAVALDRIFKRQGFAVNSTNGDKYPVQGLEKYERAFAFDKGDSLERAMCRAKLAWPRVTIPGNHVLALAAICNVAGGTLNDDHMTDTLRGGPDGTLTPNAWTQQIFERGSLNKRVVPHSLARAFCVAYSKGKKNRRLDTTAIADALEGLLTSKRVAKRQK